jgi:glycosyltransferase involved in cell wall biosynthesis
MHICYLSSYFPKSCGIASYTHYLGQAVCSVNNQNKVTVLAEQSFKSAMHSSFSVEGGFNRDEDYSKDIIGSINKIAPDIVHIQHEYGIFGYDNRFTNLLKELRNLDIPAVVTMHTVHSKLSFFTGCTKPQTRRLLKKVDIENYQYTIGNLSDLIIVHQENSIKNILVRQGVSSNNVLTLPHGTKISTTKNAEEAKAMFGIGAGTLLISSFGYFEPSKNFHLLIEAFKKLKKHVAGVKLWLGGYIRYQSAEALRYKSRCLNIIKNYQLEQDVIFSNEPLPEDKLECLIAASDVTCFVYNEDTHSSSGALHLAMGQGKALIASRISKFNELSEVSDEILINPTSVRELTALLKRLLLDKQFTNYIQNKVKLYAEKTAWDAVAQQHEQTYRHLIA